MRAYAPTGKPIVGTLETMSGTAGVIGDSFERDADGRIAYDHDGETDVDDDSETVEVGGVTMFADAGGDTWSEREVVLVDAINHRAAGKKRPATFQAVRGDLASGWKDTPAKALSDLLLVAGEATTSPAPAQPDPIVAKIAGLDLKASRGAWSRIGGAVLTADDAALANALVNAYRGGRLGVVAST